MISSTLAVFGRATVRLLAPAYCLLCRRFDDPNHAAAAHIDPWLCDACRRRLPFYSGPPWSARHRALGFMEGGIKELLHAYKFEGARALTDTWVRLIETSFELTDWIENCDVISAVPLHPMKLRRRGYNQSLLLAQALARRFEKPCVVDLLQKRLPTVAQATLSRTERLHNIPALRQSLHCDRERLPTCGSLLLVDDVVTTGATLLSCVATLQTAFPELRIRTLSLAVTNLQFLPTSDLLRST